MVFESKKIQLRHNWCSCVVLSSLLSEYRLGEEEAPRSNYLWYTFFKSIMFFKQLFTTFTLSFRRVSSDFPLNQHNKYKIIYLEIWIGVLKQLRQIHCNNWLWIFHILNKYYNSWQRDKSCKTIDVMRKYFKSKPSYQHIYIKNMFKLFYHLHHYTS